MIPMLQLRPAASTAPAVRTQLVVAGSMEKSVGLGPVKEALLASVSALFPVLATLNTLTALGVPLSWFPKFQCPIVPTLRMTWVGPAVGALLRM